MFGYVTANWDLLDEPQRLRYRSCYCGLCHTLRQEYSQTSRLSLNYDMTFLVLLLSSLYEPEEEAGARRCLVHPIRRQPCFSNDWSRYGAAMNVILSYRKCLDDWNDEGSLLKLAESGLFRGASRRAERQYPRQAEAVERELSALSTLESEGVLEPDRAANCFARLMGELFVPDPGDRWAGELRALGEGLGRFVYLSDAAVDLKEDLERGRYNPLAALAPDGGLPARFAEDLSVLLGEGTAAFERLPLVQDAGLLRNILYAGVWTPYNRAMEQCQEGERPI